MDITSMAGDQTEVIWAIERIRTITIVFVALVMASASLRTYVRIWIRKGFGPSDWYMVITAVFAAIYSGLTLYNTTIADQYYHDNATVTPVYESVARTVGIFYTLTLVALKLSVGYFFLHIFEHMRVRRVLVRIIMYASIFTGVTYISVGTLTCAQTLTGPGINSACSTSVRIASNVTFSTFSAVNIVADFGFAIMGISTLWSMCFPMPTKVLACLILVLGSAGGAASTVRLVVVLQPTSNYKDPRQWLIVERWVLIELATGIVAANLATLRVLLQKLLPNFGLLRKVSRSKSVPILRGASAASLVGFEREAGMMSVTIMETLTETTLPFDEERNIEISLVSPPERVFVPLRPRKMTI